MWRFAPLCFSITCSLLASDSYALQQGPAERIGEARQLYDSAQYEQALTMMDGVDPASVTPEQGRDRTVYRALCLLALDRPAQAEASIAEQIARDPLFQPTGDMPPRLRSLVTQVAATLRPKLLQQHYRVGKQHFDANEYDSAIEEFTLVIGLADAGSEPESQQEDIRTLAVGFRDLSRRALTAAPSSAPPVKSQPIPAKSASVVPPRIIRQDVPRWPAALGANSVPSARNGLLEIVVGPTGAVESAKMVRHIHPQYDALLLAATKNWSYEPASQDGKPIEYVKRVEVNIVPK
jgi:hypothetical protein